MIDLLKMTAAVTGFFLVSIWIKELVSLAAMLLTAKRFHFRCRNIDLFGLKFDWQNGRWHFGFWKPSAMCQYNLTVDLSRPIPPDLDKKEAKLNAIRIGSQLEAAVILLVVCRGCVARTIGMEGTIPDAFLAGTAIGLLFHSLVSVGIVIYTYKVMMKRLGGYVDHLVKRLRAGETFASMNLRPVDELPFKNPSKVEIMMYYNFYLYYLLDTGQPELMRGPIREMTDYFRNRQFIIQETMSYYWLIYYYSRFEINPPAARHFLDQVFASITKDKDANAKRVLAYYAFGIDRDIDQAQRLVNEGLEVLGSFSGGAEQEMERRLLMELQGYIDEYRRGGQQS